MTTLGVLLIILGSLALFAVVVLAALVLAAAIVLGVFALIFALIKKSSK